MDYIYTTIHHPYSSVDLPYWPLTRAFPHGVNLGTSGVPNPPRSVAARLLDLDAHSFPSKYERRSELDKLKSRRRLENSDWGLLPHDSYSISLHPTHYYPIRTSYSASDVRVPFRPATPLSRYQVRPHHMVSIAPLSAYRLPMPDPSLDHLTIDYEKEEARIQQAKEARRQQSVRWQSEATDRLLRQCREKNRARNFQRRVENARLVAPIFMSHDSDVGTRSKILIKHHKGASEQAAADKETPPVTGRAAAAARREEREERKRDEEPTEQKVTLGLKKESVSTPPIFNGVCDDDDEDNTVTEQVTIGLHRPKKAEEEPIAAEESANITITLPPMRRSSSIKVEEPAPVEEVEACASIVIGGAPAAPPSPSEDVTEEATIDLNNLPKEEEPKPVEKKKKAKKEEKPAAVAEKKPKKEEKKSAPEKPATPTPAEIVPEPIPEPETVSPAVDQHDLGTKAAVEEEVRAPSPVAEVRAPTPVEKVRSPSPVPEVSAPSPIPEVSAPSPVPEVRAPSPVPEVRAPSPVSEVRSPSPVPEVRSPSPAPEVKSPSPVPEVRSPSPVPEVRSPSPVPEVRSPSPVPEVKSPSPVPEVRSPSPALEARSPSPVKNDEPLPTTEGETIANDAATEETNGENYEISRSSSAVRRLVSVVSYREGDSCDPDEWDADGAEPEPELDYSFSEGSETTRKRIVLSASDDAIADRIAAAAGKKKSGGNDEEDDEGAELERAVRVDEASTADEDTTVVEAYDADVALLNAGGELDGGVSASTNEQNAEAGDNETLSVDGSRPLSIDAESLVTDDDENVLDEALSPHKNTNDPYDPPAEEHDEDTE